ncbi:MAG: patatin-like phospholipase family protein [Polyangiaceae bacterium]|nr:patatin-like phospholipase family protein [Polyangiaceae bacterium]
MRALSLPGCACRGAFQFAVMERLARQGETFDLVAGASSGSICGAIVTAGLAAEGPTMWRSFMSRKVISPAYLPTEWSIFGMSRLLREGLKKFVPLDRIRESKTELLIATTHARTFFREAVSPLVKNSGTLKDRFLPLMRRMPKSLVVHSSRERHDIHDIIAASCFIPVVYPKLVYIDGELHIDGGAADNTLIDEWVARGADDITMVTPYTEGRVANTIFAPETLPRVPPHVKLRILCPQRPLSQKRFDFAKEPLEEALSMPHRELVIERRTEQ